MVESWTVSRYRIRIPIVCLLESGFFGQPIKLAALYTIYTIDFGVPKGGLHNFYCVKADGKICYINFPFTQFLLCNYFPAVRYNIIKA